MALLGPAAASQTTLLPRAARLNNNGDKALLLSRPVLIPETVEAINRSASQIL